MQMQMDLFNDVVASFTVPSVSLVLIITCIPNTMNLLNHVMPSTRRDLTLNERSQGIHAH